MKKLIVNADDFGLTGGVNRAIIECFRCGSVTSATLLVTGGAAAQAASLARQNPALGVGLHINLTSGRPALPPDRIASLTGSNGNFPGLKSAMFRVTAGIARGTELEAEISAQIDLCRELGIEPTHVDSHHHIYAHPRLRAIVNRVCRQKGIMKCRGYRMATRSPKALAIRVASAIPVGGEPLISPDRFSGIETMGSNDMSAALTRELRSVRGALEFMCHPGYHDKELESVSTFIGPREKELGALMSRGFLEAVRAAGAEMISFRDL